MEAKCCQINDNNIDYNNFWLPGELSNASTDSLCTAHSTENNYISESDNQVSYAYKSVQSGPMNRLLLNALVAFSDLFAGSFK